MLLGVRFRGLWVNGILRRLFSMGLVCFLGVLQPFLNFQVYTITFIVRVCQLAVSSYRESQAPQCITRQDSRS